MGWLKPVGKALGKVVPELIGVGGVLGGAALEARAQNRATDASMDATNQAMALERERDQRGEAAYKQQWEQWEASRRALMDRYGIDIAPPTMQGPGGAPGAPGAVPRMAQGGPRGMTPGMAQAKGISPMQGQNLGQLGGWNDWGRMGLKGGGNA